MNQFIDYDDFFCVLTIRAVSHQKNDPPLEDFGISIDHLF